MQGGVQLLWQDSAAMFMLGEGLQMGSPNLQVKESLPV